MSVADRMRKRREMVAGQPALTEGELGTDSRSGILAPREPPVILRLKAVLGAMQAYVSENDGGTGLGRFSWLIGDLVDELTDELAEKDSDSLALYMAQMGQVISWIGHGNDELLPETLRQFANVNELEAHRVHAS